MWVFKYLVCLVREHIWVGSRYRYCLRCGKLEMAPGVAEAGEAVGQTETVAAR